jgi:hypothetical protein
MQAPTEAKPPTAESAEIQSDERPVQDILRVAAAEDSGKQVKPDDRLTPEERADALAWFLSDTDDTDLTHTFEINVGGLENKHWVKWTIKPVDMDRLRRIRKQSQPAGNRQQRRNGQTGEFDEIAANVAIVVEGTVIPDLRAAARQLHAIEPGVLVRTRFAHKPGLLAQIAGEIMSISGYDDDDVREVDAAQG